MEPDQPSPAADVRMRGFAQRTSVHAALDWVDAQTQPLASEDVLLERAAGRVLAAPVTSDVDVPGFDRAMMDGFAVQAGSLAGAAPDRPLTLSIVGEAFPARPFTGRLAAGEAVRIMTGAPLPAGADCVLPAEQAQCEAQRLRALGQVAAGKHVGRRGENVARGSIVLNAGRRLRPQDLGLLSSVGANSIRCIRHPRVAIVITGSEVLPAGSRPHGYQVSDANGPLIAALVERDGGQLVQSTLVGDDREAIRRAIFDDADVVLVSGGSSVGQEDYAPTILAAAGQLAVHGVAMRPGGPTGMGRLGSRLVFLLPGNPVSCLCAYDVFAGRALRALGGRQRGWPYRATSARLTCPVTSAVGRLDYVRVALHSGEATPLSSFGTLGAPTVARADGFLLVPDNRDGLPAGSQVEVMLYEL